MIRTALATLALAASASFAFAATDAELSAQIVGTWGQDATCSTGTLTFNADGTFSLARPSRNDAGTWEIADGVLTGTASDGNSRPAMTVSFENDTLGMTSTGRTDTFVRCPQ